MNAKADSVTPSKHEGPVATVMFAFVAGIDDLGNSFAIAALLFTGSLASGYGLGVGVILVSGIILALAVGLRSRQRNAVAAVQETSIALLASAVAVAAGRISGPEDVKVATALAILGTSTVVTGALCFVTGRLSIGGLARFLPYPVIAGFLAGTGWLLLVGGLSMVTGQHETVAILSRLAEPRVQAVIVPAIVFALLMMIALRRISHPLTAPTLLIAAGCCFYLILWVAGFSVRQASAWGWVTQIPAGGGVSFPSPHMLARVNWRQVLNVWPIILSAAVLSMVGVLLNTSGLELETGQELDANAELRVTGVANLVSGLVGGLSGFTLLGTTLLAERMGVRGRWAGLGTALVMGLGLLFARPIVARMPVFLTSGLVIYLGLELLFGWVIESRRRLPVGEWVIVLIILLLIAAVGLLEGLAAGLLVSIVMFVYSYSRLPVIRTRASGSDMHSSVDRSPLAMSVLGRHGAAIEAVNLQGYLFFGTADRIVEHVRRRISAADQPVLRFLILDFRHVGGCDSSATACFIKVRNIAQLAGVRVLLSQVSPKVERLLRQAGLAFAPDAAISLFADIDHALETCEAALLAELEVGPPPADALHYLEAALGPHPRLEALVAAMERLDLEAGTTLIRTEDAADDIFILIRGRVRVQVMLPDGRHLRLRTMISGAILGEMAFYMGLKRTADVIVEEDSIIFRLAAAELRRMESEDSEAATLFHRLFAINLADKLTVANRLIQVANI